MQILWPSFIWAAVMVGVLFSIIDPLSIDFVQAHFNESRQAAYTMGFILCWIVISAACTTTWYLTTYKS